jgi:hypothetical protein
MAGCFEPPVREDVLLSFDERGGVEVVVTTRLEKEDSYRKNPRALERLLEAREAARCGEDAFTRQLERLAPATLTRRLSSRDGALRESVRTATFADARSVERLFEGAPVWMSVGSSGNETRLEILTGPGGRATTAERLEVSRELDRFAGATARYVAALAALWAWLDERPGLERFVVGALVGADLPEPTDVSPEDKEEGKALFDAASDAMSEVHGFFLIKDDGRGETLDELSRKVYDPFPAPLRVRVPGTVLEATGFVPEEDGGYRVPPVSLWGALPGLSGRWITPDPLAEKLRRKERASEEDPDVDRILSGGRRVLARPSAAEVREALEAALVPAPAYRLRWRRDAAR